MGLICQRIQCACPGLALYRDRDLDVNLPLLRNLLPKNSLSIYNIPEDFG